MITASIVAYHTPINELSNLLECVIKSSIDKLYLIDNSSNDSLRDVGNLSSKIVYIHSANLGFGHGHNLAIKKAIEFGAQYHVVINPDIYWDGDVIESLATYLDNHQNCGLVMPKVLYPNGNIQYLCKLLPTPLNLFGRRFLPFKELQRKIDEHYELHFTGYNKEMEVPSLSGCFMFLRVDVLKKVGIFDERYFMYAEDLDLCRRIGEVSRTMFYPEVSVYHAYEKGSYKNKKLLKYHICSVIKYFNKWGWIFDKKRTQKNKECLVKLIN
ncbi:glycosyltransferase family 2 protein [uncultured Bacteroides sp.]|uniref:glycosyltransferase n=1 Tax=uncultured Bacteroides sp. TaxID=162156 RepID=UPI0026086522|nr:glycosyltransferase family 2 protein [uncultured Bacteroides sp.]